MSRRETDIETMLRHVCTLACDICAEHEGLDGALLWKALQDQCPEAKSLESWANALACLTADDLADVIRREEAPNG